MVKDPTKPVFTISVAAELVGLHPRTLMLYEKEELISPHRTETDRRMFSPLDLQKVQFIQHLTQQRGLNLAGVKLMLSAIAWCEEKGLNLREFLFSDFKPASPF